MTETSDLILWFGLNRLMIDYWTEVDENGGVDAHTFYLPDALYAVGENRFQGQESIRVFYEQRRRRENATTRHLVDNVRVFRQDLANATARGVMSLNRAEGLPPIEEARPLTMIADFEARCVLGVDHVWRFRSHVLTPIFVGSNRPFSVTVDPDRLPGRGGRP